MNSGFTARCAAPLVERDNVSAQEQLALSAPLLESKFWRLQVCNRDLADGHVNDPFYNTDVAVVVPVHVLQRHTDSLTLKHTESPSDWYRKHGIDVNLSDAFTFGAVGYRRLLPATKQTPCFCYAPLAAFAGDDFPNTDQPLNGAVLSWASPNCTKSNSSTLALSEEVTRRPASG